jgi:hypothetical protein
MIPKILVEIKRIFLEDSVAERLYLDEQTRQCRG